MSTATLALEERSPAPSAAVTDLVLEHIAPGEALFTTEARPGDGVANDRGSRTMLDLALAAAVQSLLAPGESYRTVDVVVTGHQAERALRGRVEATAHVVRAGCGVLVATGHVRSAGDLRVTGRLVARVTPARESR